MKLAPWQRIQAFARTLGADVVPVAQWWTDLPLIRVDPSVAPYIGAMCWPPVRRTDTTGWSKVIDLGPGVAYSLSDGDLALHYGDKRVFINVEQTSHPETVGGLIHELGHVLAMREPPPGEGEELDFLGWEWLVAKETNCLPQWHASMKDYGMADGSEFGKLTSEEQADALQTALIAGRRYGNVSPQYKPISVRDA